MNRKAAIQTLESMILMSACAGDHSDHGGHDDHWEDAGSGLLHVGTDYPVADLDGYDLIVSISNDSHSGHSHGPDILVFVRDNDHSDGNDPSVVHIQQSDPGTVQITQLENGGVSVVTDDIAVFIGHSGNNQGDGGSDTPVALPGQNMDPEYRTIDGTNNNLHNTELGSTDERLIRLADSEYADGISEPAGADRPSARSVSNELAVQRTEEVNGRGLTDVTWLWGQFLDHDISLSTGAEPHEPFNIRIPSGDALFDPGFTGDAEIELNRTIHDPESGQSEANPREQINEITAWIDGSMVYGSDDMRAAELRSFEGGRLRVTDDNLLIFNDSGLPNAADGVPPGTDLFLAGDVRANENIALTAMHTLWVREHNRLADEIAAADPALTDEEIYQQARHEVIALIQAITYQEFLPAILGDGAISDYQGYDPYVDPSIANEFSTAAYRFGHTMVASQLLRPSGSGSGSESDSIALRDAFFAPDEILDHGIDSVLLGVTQQAANEIDTMVVDDIRNFLFGPPGAGGFDLASLNIQRGRDHGLADYNQVRTDLGLDPVTDFADITSDTSLQRRLETVYGSVDNIDLWIGGLAEDHVAGSSLGETFRTIIADQFSRLRDGDRFWYENVLDGQQLEEVRMTTLADVIERNTMVSELQANVFFQADAVYDHA